MRPGEPPTKESAENLFFNLFLVGVLLCLAFLYTKNLWTCVGLHAGWVVCIQSLFKTFNEVEGAHPFFGTERVADGYLVTLFLIGFVVMFCLLMKFSNRDAKSWLQKNPDDSIFLPRSRKWFILINVLVSSRHEEVRKVSAFRCQQRADRMGRFASPRRPILWEQIHDISWALAGHSGSRSRLRRIRPSTGKQYYFLH